VPAAADPEETVVEPVLPFTTMEGVLINSGPFSGMGCEEAIAKMSEHAEQNSFGKATVNYRLKDWGVSRQRYWGTPIPMLYCEKDGIVPVPEKDLPVVLPDQVQITLTGGSPLANVPEFLNATCPKCGGPARRETDTMDTFVDSSWYFYRYTDARNDQAPFDKKTAAYWFGEKGIDRYIGGVEHAILHLIYSRFWTKVMRDLGLVENDEPVQRLFTQGMIIKGGAKMSKSVGNVVAPDEMVARYGADAARMYTLFATSPDSELDWQDSGIEGIQRFLGRLYRFFTQSRADRTTQGYAVGELTPAARQVLRKLHQTIKRITEDFQGRWHFNTSVAALMELLNQCYDAKGAFGPDATSPAAFRAEVQKSFVLMLAPFAPYMANELWEYLGETSNLLKAPWPKYDPALAKADEIEIPVQVNGKLRSLIVVPADANQKMIEERALAEDKIRTVMDGKQVVKIIFVPGKLVNIVVR